MKFLSSITKIIILLVVLILISYGVFTWKKICDEIESETTVFNNEVRDLYIE